MFAQIVSIRVKALSNTNLVASRQFKLTSGSRAWLKNVAALTPYYILPSKIIPEKMHAVLSRVRDKTACRRWIQLYR